ncbi:hypothetical protein BU23DRAFT_647143 [Bimuria novae-zelandiae CBS 107.79]|uniref:Uncharacterized protein n=1 Tax=Bimuria novae-zelandiae CBS 107.79 TaxID=1447943 RepID=A0A6A5VN58_9PLEO|nr:hypothetical protein BU23DRAFT_647143 [Bimuria novae-zelandiae CBS 107.79]
MASDHSIEAVTTLPSQRPRMHAPMKDHYPLPARLENAITSYSVHLIMALITLPTLIWHISSTHIHDDYGMPDDWVEKFDTTQFTSKRGLLWGFLFAVVSLRTPASPQNF